MATKGRMPASSIDRRVESRAFVYAVVLMLGTTFTLTLTTLAWNSALEAAQRDFALESLGLQTRLARSVSAVDDLLRNLARPPFALDQDALPEIDELHGLVARLPFVEALSVYTRQPDGLVESPPVQLQLQVEAVQRPEHAMSAIGPGTLAAGIDASLAREEVVPLVYRGRLALVYAVCHEGRATHEGCRELKMVTAHLSRDQLLEGFSPEGLEVVVDVEAEGLLGRRRYVDVRPASPAREGFLTSLLTDTVRVTMPGYHLRLQLQRPVDVLDRGAGLLLTALLVGGGATLLLVALVRARGAQLQALADRNLEISRQVESQTRELAAARDAALAAARTKAEFVATMSHEIRTPLNAIMGMSELLAESTLGLEQRQYVEVHRRASENLLALLNDVLDLSKAEAGQLSFARDPFDLRAVCEQSVDLFALRAAEKGLLIYLHLDPALPRVVLGDAPRLRQVLANLLGNAVKFTEQGEVALRVMPAADVPGQVHLMVADTGVGVPQDQLEHVFGAFAQVDSTPRRRHGGTGLGLAICRELVQRMDGRIWLESVEGQGSTFHAVVHLAPAADASTLFPAAVDAVAAEETAGKAWLILEPEAGLRAALVDLATAAGHAEVSVVTELPQQACAVATRLLCRAELLESLSVQLPQGLHVVALMPVTGLADRLDRLRALGVSAYVLMPPKLTDLCQPALLDAGGGRATAIHSRASLANTSAEGCATTPVVTAADGDTICVPRLLLVDDSVDNRQLVQAFLRGQPWQVDEACDGASAVAAAQALRYDLILMDIQMPGMDGYAAIQAIRALEEASGRLPSPIVALSAHTAKEDIDRAHTSGCDAYLAKPLRKSALLECIATVKDTTGR